MSSLSFSYDVLPISKLKAILGAKSADKRKRQLVRAVEVNGEEISPTKRFWKSFQMRFKLNTNVFNYYSHGEVFQRISEVSPNNKVRLCIERIEGQKPKLLGVTNPQNAIVQYNKLGEILDKNGYDNVNYSEGYVRSMHEPKFNSPLDIAGDKFVNKFVVDTPIDGFGRPQIYLSMLREICSNGMIGFAPTFRSEIQVGKGQDAIEFSLTRALQSYNNEEGYAALHQRIESGAKSWASVNEAQNLQKLVMKLYGEKQLVGVKKIVIGESNDNQDHPCLTKLTKVTGDLNKLYGLSNLDALSPKKQRALPAGCKVYDLLNLASEIATHHSTPTADRRLQGYMGNLLSNEYDLEGTCDRFSDYKDFFIGNDETAQVLADMQKNSGGF